MRYIYHRIVEDGNQAFALADMADVGTYIVQIIVDTGQGLCTFLAVVSLTLVDRSISRANRDCLGIYCRNPWQQETRRQSE
jgi:hypothetical protein